MSKQILALTLSAVTLAFSHSSAQAQPVVPPLVVQGTVNTPIAQGNIARFTINPFGEVDGFYLLTAPRLLSRRTCPQS